MTFAERLKELRTEKGLSLGDVASYLNVKNPTIYKYEHGIITNVPPERVHQLAILFNVTRPYLMGWSNERLGDPGDNLEIVADKLRTPLIHQFEMVNSTIYWKHTGKKTIDCTTAATQAARALIKFNVSRTPIYPQQILQASEKASIISFEEESELEDLCETNAVMSSQQGDMVMTSVIADDREHEHYLFTVRRNAPLGKLKLAIAIEIGHIYLGHGFNIIGSDKATTEAECFALHLEFPRAMIRLLHERNVVLTKSSFSRIFGDCEWCLDSILNARPVRISPELNRLLKEQFTPYVDRLEDDGVFLIPSRGEELDLSRYMAGYEE